MYRFARMTIAQIDKEIRRLINLRMDMTRKPEFMDVLLLFVSTVCNIKVALIKSRSKKRPITDARCLVIYHMFEAGYTHYMIGKKLSLHHGAITQAVKKYRRLYQSDIEFRSLAIKLKEQWSKQSSTLLQHLNDPAA